jgi:hypothetical protein
MATIREITTMCKSGQVADAYGLAKAVCEAEPQNVWAQRGVGWVLYYMLKNDVERKERSAFYGHLEELAALDLLTMQTDALIFDNVVWKLAELIKQIPAESTDELDRIYSFLIKYTFIPSTGYSVLLKQLLGFETWNRLVEFFEWWNIDNLMPEDYQPFKMENGRKVMSLAEQAYIAYSKALLKRNDREKIEDFVPKIEKLMEDYPDMMYPGYFCGKLKLAMGVERESALDIIMPFVRKKKTEFWVWQLLSEFYRGESDVQLACLLRAIHCKTQETFLGKVRMKLVSAYVQRRDYPRAKYHLDQVVRCYVQQGWHLPYELQNWMKESWVNNTQADSSDGIDYMRYTDAILTRGANTSIAIVTYVDYVKKRALVVYAERKRANIPLSNLGVKVKEGTLLELQWTAGTDGSIVVAGSRIVDRQSLKGVSYIQVVEGKISKRENNAFAFIKKGNLQCYIRAEIIQNQHVNDNDDAVVIAVLDYNKKKDSWNWNCVTLQKTKR